ncbi:MAG: hypothetical protein ABI556_04065 [Gemmatimonadales bacterium]
MRSTSTMKLAAVIALTAACSNSTAPFSPPYNPVFPTSWASAVTHQYYPLVPGTTWQYRSQASNGETITVEVLPAKETVNGVSATAVRDRVFLNGVLVEDTFDWYAQDSEGNVWYVGEDTKEYKNGVVVSTEGSWRWGVDGALPGIQMWATPSAKIGIDYRQEYYKGQAEDWAKILRVSDAVTVPFGSMANCIAIEEWAGLAPNEAHEAKVYCPGVGNVSGSAIGATDGYVLISKSP